MRDLIHRIQHHMRAPRIQGSRQVVHAEDKGAAGEEKADLRTVKRHRIVPSWPRRELQPARELRRFR